MVPGHHHEHISIARLAVGGVQQLLEELVGLEGHLALFRREGAVGVPYVVVGGEADRQHIGIFMPAEVLGFQDALGEALQQVVSVRALLDRPV